MLGKNTETKTKIITNKLDDVNDVYCVHTNTKRIVYI